MNTDDRKAFGDLHSNELHIDDLYFDHVHFGDEKLFNDLLLSSDFLFHDGYSVPKVKCLHEYIDKFSLIDPLQIFGLHPNADNNIFNKST
ncbi:unnamed protein product [Rotaria sp. Silwood2]|nr:unnamed protein product [Rotaria sp. Silwood2]